MLLHWQLGLIWYKQFNLFLDEDTIQDMLWFDRNCRLADKVCKYSRTMCTPVSDEYCPTWKSVPWTKLIPSRIKWHLTLTSKNFPGEDTLPGGTTLPGGERHFSWGTTLFPGGMIFSTTPVLRPYINPLSGQLCSTYWQWCTSTSRGPVSYLESTRRENFSLQCKMIYSSVSISYTYFSNLITARYLAVEMEEDDDNIKRDLLPWALGRPWSIQYRDFLDERYALWRTIHYRAAVSCTTCHEVSLLIQLAGILWLELEWGR